MEYNRFIDYIKYNKNRQIRTIERYTYILDKIPERIFTELTSKDDIFKLDNWLRNNDGRDGFSFYKNGSLVKYAIKSYLRFLNKRDIVPYVDNLNLKSKKKSKSFKYHGQLVINELISNAKYKLVYKNNLRDYNKVHRVRWATTTKPKYEAERDMLFIKFLFHTGARCSEALNVQQKDIDVKKKVVNITRGKGGYNRDALITSELINELNHFCDINKIKPFQNIFQFDVSINKKSSRYIKFLSQFGVTEANKLYLELRRLTKAEYMVLSVGKLVVNQKNITPHQMRHSLAMLLKKNGVQLDKIQQVLGHNSITTTQIYAKTTLEDAKDEYKNIMSELK